eukprot:5333635-Prymnesium_polylepis.2
MLWAQAAKNHAIGAECTGCIVRPWASVVTHTILRKVARVLAHPPGLGRWNGRRKRGRWQRGRCGRQRRGGGRRWRWHRQVENTVARRANCRRLEPTHLVDEHEGHRRVQTTLEPPADRVASRGIVGSEQLIGAHLGRRGERDGQRACAAAAQPLCAFVAVDRHQRSLIPCYPIWGHAGRGCTRQGDLAPVFVPEVDVGELHILLRRVVQRCQVAAYVDDLDGALGERSRRRIERRRRWKRWHWWHRRGRWSRRRSVGARATVMAVVAIGAVGVS